MLILRNLGRALAPTSKVIDSSSSPEKPSPNGVGNRGASSSRRGAGRRNSDEDDELPIDRPRLSLPIDENSSDDLQPPHSSILEDPNMTIQSVELLVEPPVRVLQGAALAIWETAISLPGTTFMEMTIRTLIPLLILPALHLMLLQTLKLQIYSKCLARPLTQSCF